MTLYSRSDLMSVTIPVTSGGCGNSHSRPVKYGAPVKTWALTCQPCESFLRGDKKAKIIQVIPGDKDRGIPSTMKHIADADPMWSTTPEGVPQTPDEQQVHRIRSEQGQRQLETLSAFAALKQANVEIPAQAQWVVDKILEEIAQREMGSLAAKGSVTCADGHENHPGTKFCSECGVSLTQALTSGEIRELYEEPEALASLHVNTLKKMCRERGLPAQGTKVELVKRLSVPATITLGSTNGFNAGDGNF